MTENTQKPNVARVLAGLKDFQRESVEYVFSRLYGPHPTRRFLLADEVGLGKTLVARGVIARTLEHLRRKVDRIDIVYICSNSDIARQNINRLNVLDNEVALPTRLTLLPTQIKSLQDNPVNFVSLTPGTSFDLSSGAGTAEERVLLHDLLQRAWNTHGAGPLNVLQAYKDRHRFRMLVRRHHREVQVDPGIARGFVQDIRQHDQKAKQEDRPTLRGQFRELCDRFSRSRKHVPREDRQQQTRFIGQIRAMLAATCIRALEPDLIILDEFQRFRDLLRGESGAGQLAQYLFEWEEARVLLLSATPYKMYSLAHEGGEDHYEDFLETLRFLVPDSDDLNRCRKLLKQYRSQLYQLSEGPCPELDKTKAQIETLLRTVMCRTERLAVTEDRSGMLCEVPISPLPLKGEDVRAYLELQAVAGTLDAGNMVEYWKSAPYALSFMDNYDVKRRLIERSADPEYRKPLADHIRTASHLCLPWKRVRRYKPIDPCNARVRHLIENTVGVGMWQTLWVPPTLPYYRLGGPYAKSSLRSFTKRLVFSCWQVVPKALATLLSYDAESRMMRLYEKDPLNTTEARKKRRPLLTFSFSENRLSGMPVLGLMYPSLTLATRFDPMRTFQEKGQDSLDAMVEAARSAIREPLAGLTKMAATGGPEDESWYWAGPILLDRQLYSSPTRDWWEQPRLAGVWGRENSEDPEESRWSDHVSTARQVLEGGAASLGRPPADLLDVLAQLAVGGPAVVALRALSRICAGDAPLADIQLRNLSGQIGWAFRSLFNLPEVTALIRGMDPQEPYWRRILEYSIAGCLQSVLDEYGHVLRDALGLMDVQPAKAGPQIAEAITNAVSLRVATPNVDRIRLDRDTGEISVKPQRLRARFAMRFGGDRAEDSGKELRGDLVRHAFNSPFYPFVLITTSVGQEGLDFHPYCHAVVHWNLPSNPVDFEQREGRIHRYKGHAVRKNIASHHGGHTTTNGHHDIWQELFEKARLNQASPSDLQLYWVYPGDAKIERHVPTLALSREWDRLPLMRRSLAVYRMVFGQPRQDDLLAYLLSRVPRDRLNQEMHRFRVDLSPRVR